MEETCKELPWLKNSLKIEAVYRERQDSIGINRLTSSYLIKTGGC